MNAFKDVRLALRRTLAVFAIGAVTIPTLAVAAAQDYRFELVGALVKNGATAIAKVRLIHVSDGKPAPGASIVQTKLDMGPEGMAGMMAPSKVSAMPGMAGMTSPTKPPMSSDNDLYAIELQPSMAGKWALTLTAKVPGETEMVTQSLTITVPK